MTTAKKQECENFKILVESLKPEESIQIIATRGGLGVLRQEVASLPQAQRNECTKILDEAEAILDTFPKDP